MTAHVHELLPEYAAGTLAAAAAAEVEAHLAGCTRCASELAAIDDALAELALALPAPPTPAALRERVLGAVARTGRFQAFAGRVAALIDVAADKARELVELIDQAASWTVGPLGTQLIHLSPGPRVAHANCGFIRLPAGTRFPTHRHLGEEQVLILQGGYVDSSGRTLRPGDVDVKATGSEHAFTVLPGIDLVYLVVLENGIEVAGEPEVEL